MGNKMPREIAPGVFWIGDCLAPVSYTHLTLPTKA